LIAVVSLLIVVVVVLIAARIAAVALTATGLPFEVARFQARSALTGVGFTTGESEAIVSHPLRRRIVMFLMLVGNAGFVTIVASVMVTFANARGGSPVLARLGIIVGGLLVISLFAHSRIFERRFTGFVARVVDRVSDLDLRDYHHLMQLSRDYAVTELQVRPGDWLANKPLAGLELPDEGVLVLAVQRADGGFLGAPRGQTKVRPYDTLILYGRASVLSDLDARPATWQGDVAHAEAVAEQQVIMADREDEDAEEV
jgi:hypothetical protein